MLLTLLLTAAVAGASAPRFDAVQMMKLKRLADPQLSPDGKWVAYQATDVALDAGGPGVAGPLDEGLTGRS